MEEPYCLSDFQHEVGISCCCLGSGHLVTCGHMQLLFVLTCSSIEAGGFGGEKLIVNSVEKCWQKVATSN